MTLKRITDEEIRFAFHAEKDRQCGFGYSAGDLDICSAVAQAQLDKIFNLDIETTAKLIEKLKKRLDKLYEEKLEHTPMWVAKEKE